MWCLRRHISKRSIDRLQIAGHLLRRTAKKCPHRIEDTPAVLFCLSPCIYLRYLQTRWRGISTSLLRTNKSSTYQNRHGWRWFQAEASLLLQTCSPRMNQDVYSWACLRLICARASYLYRLFPNALEGHIYFVTAHKLILNVSERTGMSVVISSSEICVMHKSRR